MSTNIFSELMSFWIKNHLILEFKGNIEERELTFKFEARKKAHKADLRLKIK